MLPACRRLFRHFHSGELISAVDAYYIARSNLPFKPVGNIPIICHYSRLPLPLNARNRRIYGGGFFVPSFSAQKERRSKFRMVAIVIGTNVMHLEPPPHL